MRKAGPSAIPYLMPRVTGREEKKRRRALEQGLFREVVVRAALDRNPADLLFEVYLAGIMHGAEIIAKRGDELAEPEPPEPTITPAAHRVVDRIIIRKRGRPRSTPIEQED